MGNVKQAWGGLNSMTGRESSKHKIPPLNSLRLQIIFNFSIADLTQGTLVLNVTWCVPKFLQHAPIVLTVHKLQSALPALSQTRPWTPVV